jgi:hypothetical protein
MRTGGPAINEYGAARVFSANRLGVGRNDAFDMRFNRSAFVAGEEGPRSECPGGWQIDIIGSPSTVIGNSGRDDRPGTCAKYVVPANSSRRQIASLCLALATGLRRSDALVIFLSCIRRRSQKRYKHNDESAHVLRTSSWPKSARVACGDWIEKCPGEPPGRAGIDRALPKRKRRRVR